MLPWATQATLTPEEQAEEEAVAEAALKEYYAGLVEEAEETREDIEEEAGEQGFVVEDLAGEIGDDP
eukprot:g10898.t1